MPPSDLAPYIRRFYVFESELPDDAEIEDFLLGETAMVRLTLKGDWQGELSPGEWGQRGNVLLFGANNTPCRVRVKGSFSITGFSIRPSGWAALFDVPPSNVLDQIIPLQELWGDVATEMLAGAAASKIDSERIAAMEMAVRKRLSIVGNPNTDPQMARFEFMARKDCTVKVNDAARIIGLSVRQFERRCHKTFGTGPKAVLRRNRFLDMATAMRGFSSPTKAELAALSFFDQSHVAREFRQFTKMSPTEFAQADTPMQTAGLKLREESKFEV